MGTGQVLTRLLQNHHQREHIHKREGQAQLYIMNLFLF